MSKLLKYILFRAVLVIITLHAVIFHPHSNRLTSKQHLELHKKSNSLIGLIRLAFHESDDESLDNLVIIENESVKKIDSNHQYPTAFIFDPTTLIVEPTVENKTATWNITNFNSLFFVKQNALRGPPLHT